MSDKFYITTPIFYPNGTPHIGHAYTVIATDVLARFARLDGRDVFFLSGTDEHGTKMQQTAIAQGITPLELADQNSSVFQQMLATFNCSNDDFIRTTQPRHHAACQEIWKKMQENGDIYLSKYGGWYSVRQEAYFDEKETSVSEDGIRREPLGSPVEWVEEENYYFKLSNYADKLLELYESQPDFVGPNERLNEVASFVKSGLRDFSISRTTFDWGIKVPNDPAHVMYVWVDALTNYLTAIGYPNTQGEMWNYWPATHIIGKDIVRFHAVYWPAMLMSAGLPLPKRIFAHGFVLNDGTKMSKSVGNVVDPFEMIERYGLDKTRYFLMREIPFGQDGSYCHETFVNRTNADLANNLGNLAQRSLSMIAKNCTGKVPTPSHFTQEDSDLLARSQTVLQSVRKLMNEQAIHTALGEIIELSSEVNRYFDTQAPWTLRKTDLSRFETVLYVTIETIRCIALLLQPFIPESAEKLLNLMAVEQEHRSFDYVGGKGALRAGDLLPPPVGIFPRFVEGEA